MSARANRIVIIGIVVCLLVLAGAAVTSSWSPTIPGDAAMTPVTETAPNGGQECLDRITNATGHMDVCWSVWPVDDLNADNDYYKLRVYGTVRGSGSGIRWWALRAHLAGEPSNGALSWWPTGAYDGRCGSQPVDGLDPDNQHFVELCPRTTGQEGASNAYSVRWTCVGCVVPDHSDRGVVLYSFVSVPQGTVPTWSIGADFGA